MKQLTQELGLSLVEEQWRQAILSSIFGAASPESQLLETNARVYGGQSSVWGTYKRCYSRTTCTDQTNWLLRPFVFMDYTHGLVVSCAVWHQAMI